MQPGTEYKEGCETEENYMETALIQLTRINDQFIFLQSYAGVFIP